MKKNRGKMSTTEEETLPIEVEIDLEKTSDDTIIESIKIAMSLVDDAIAEISHRQTVPVSEMTDLLLDVRLALAPLIL